VREVGNSLTALALVKRACEHPSQAIRRTADVAHARMQDICLRAGEELNRSSNEEPTATPPQVAKEEPPADGATPPPQKRVKVCVDPVARGLGAFVVGLQSKEEGPSGEKEADPVTRGLELFLAEQRRRVGPICALQAPGFPPGARPPPTPAAAGSIFRPPLKQEEEEGEEEEEEEEEDEGSVKEELASEAEATPNPSTARSATRMGRSPSRYSASRASPETSRAQSMYSPSRASPETSRAQSRSPRRRTPSPPAHSTWGTSCGASDAFSGSGSPPPKESDHEASSSEGPAVSSVPQLPPASTVWGYSESSAYSTAASEAVSDTAEDQPAATAAGSATSAAGEKAAGTEPPDRRGKPPAAPAARKAAPREAPPGVHFVDIEPSDDEMWP